MRGLASLAPPTWIRQSCGCQAAKQEAFIQQINTSLLALIAEFKGNSARKIAKKLNKLKIWTKYLAHKSLIKIRCYLYTNNVVQVENG